MAEETPRARAAGAERAGLLGRLLPNWLLATGSCVLFAAVLAALARGQAHWHAIPLLVWLHLGTMLIALGLTPVMLLRPKGDVPHRALGYAWLSAILASAGISLFLKFDRNDGSLQGLGVFTGDFSPIHALSILVLIMGPLLVYFARTHNRAAHERVVRGLVMGALLLAGGLTFPFGRLLGAWLFG